MDCSNQKTKYSKNAPHLVITPARPLTSGPVQTHIQRQYVTARPVTPVGLTAQIWAATLPVRSSEPDVVEFLALLKETSAQMLSDVELCE